MKSSVGLSLPEYTFNTSQTALVIGAGLAGCAIAQALAKRGYHCRVFDQHETIAASTSALPAAVIRPAINGDQLFTDYFSYAFDLCCQSIDKNLFTQCGSLELTDNSERDRVTTDDSRYKLLTADEASTLAGTKVDSAIHIKQAGFVKPQALCNHWLAHNNIEIRASTTVDGLRKTQEGWQLLSDSGAVIDESHVVILATAQNTVGFDLASELPLHCAAGQIDLFACGGTPLNCIINGNGYLLPDKHGVWCGATHHPLQTIAGQFEQKQSPIKETDSQTNKATAKHIAQDLSIGASPVASFASVRTFTPDRLPVVGALHDTGKYRQNYADLKHGKTNHHYPPPCFHEGLYLATGLGSRGATQALAIGELISNLLSGDYPGMGDPDNPQRPTAKQLLQALHPGRFLIRALRRGL